MTATTIATNPSQASTATRRARASIGLVVLGSVGAGLALGLGCSSPSSAAAASPTSRAPRCSRSARASPSSQPGRDRRRSRSGGRSRPASVPASPARRCWRPHRAIGRSRSPARARPAPLVALVGWLGPRRSPLPPQPGLAARCSTRRRRRCSSSPWAAPSRPSARPPRAIPHPPACTYAVDEPPPLPPLHRCRLPRRRCCSARPRRAADELGVGAAGGVVDDPRLRLRPCRRGLERPGALAAAGRPRSALGGPARASSPPPASRRHDFARRPFGRRPLCPRLRRAVPAGRRRRRPDRRLHAVPVRPARRSGLLRDMAARLGAPAHARPHGPRPAHARHGLRRPPRARRARTLARSRLRPASSARPPRPSSRSCRRRPIRRRR